MRKTGSNQAIAIIGIGLRFPKSESLDEFWTHLLSQESLITEIPAERWDKHEFYGDPQKEEKKTNSIWGGFIDQANCFDASFFNISPREATYMDPQQRITLELAWKAIEDAGYRAGTLKSTKTGVFMGVCNTDYTELMEKHLRDFDAYVPTGTSNAILSNRISYWFDFKGPSLTIDSACASSLVAIHQAVRSLENEDCDYALAGGVNLCWSPRRFIALSKSGMLSKDGTCKAFDKKADGYVRAEGAAVLLLKPLDKAIEDRDSIYAVIKGVGTNHGGRTNSLTITNPKAQAELIIDVYEKAGISPDSVSYIETHGPGTPLGDPIEIHGLKNAFKHFYQKEGKTPIKTTCGLGSVKTNIGHLEAAAGIAGVIKVVAAMKHRILPASIHFQEQNPIIKLEDSPFYIVDETVPWTTPEDAAFPRRAGVSSFGFGGSNAHILLEEYVAESPTGLPEQEPETDHNAVLIPISARNISRLREYVAEFVEFLRKSTGLVLQNLAYTLQVGREAMPERVVFVTHDIPELLSQCEALLQNEDNQPNCWRGEQIKQEKELGQLPEIASYLPDSKAQWYAECPAEKLAQLWSEGYTLEWELLYLHLPAKRINLPTYPFAREPYWIPMMEPADSTDKLSLPSLSAITVPSGQIQSGAKPRISLAALDASSEWPEEKQAPLSLSTRGAAAADIAAGALMNELTISLADALAMAPGEIDADAKFIDLGLDSIIGVEWVRKVNDRYHTSLAVTKVYDYPTIREFSHYLSAEIPKQPERAIVELAQPPAVQPEVFSAMDDESNLAYSVEELREELRSSLAEALAMNGRDIEDDVKFVDLGLDSIIGVEWIRKVNDRYQTAIAVTRVYDYPTLYEFAEYLGQEIQKQGSAAPLRDGNDRSLSSPTNRSIAVQASHEISYNRLREELKAGLAEALAMNPGDVDDDAKFVDLGLDSIIGVEWIHKVNERYGTFVAVTKVYDYPTIADFTAFIQQELQKTNQRMPAMRNASTMPNETPAPHQATRSDQADEPTLERKFALQPNRSDEPAVANQEVVAVREISPGVVQVTMQDRLNKNKFSERLIQALIQTVEAIQMDPKYKIIILTGYDTYFAAGGTEENLLDIYQGKARYTDSILYRLALDCRIPIIAAMQGHGIGAGWCFGMSCDFVVMSQESYYATNFMKFGFTPGFGSTLLFPEKLGIGLAQEILFTGRRYRGSELQARGIPFPVLPRSEVLPYAVQLAQELAESPRETLIILKNHLVEPLRAKIASTIDKEIRMHDQTFVNQAEVKERIHSFFGQFAQGAPSTIEMDKPLNESTIPKQTSEISPDNSIAIIGVSGQFPKSKNLDEFWENLAHGRDCISEVPANRWSVEHDYDPDPEAPGKSHSKWMGLLEDADLFDPLFFNIAPAEAELMDPQQRLFLEHCWRSIEDAGLSPASLSGSRCGVFVGCATNDYGQFIDGQELNARRLMGGSSSILSSRISYYLNLKGPCLAIDTACSSSLVAIAEACNSLVLKTSDLALAGGVCVLVGPDLHIMTSKAGMLSKDGRCFTFDNRANGFVPSEGVGVVLLKRLSDAVRDQDQIYGVIRGWGINQDGRTNGITAPSVNSQILLEKEVYQRFGISPDTISMVEAHGTGTKLGDPIEVEALTEAFRSYTQRKHYCALGSVKSNIGHTLTAAGVAGVIKVLLALKHRMLPPTIHYETLNEHIALADSPFYINDRMQPWEPEQAMPRRACVSSFGFSGTNSHVVIEEYVPAEGKRLTASIHPGNPALFVLSAKSNEQLKAYAGSINDYLASHPEIDLADAAYTLQVGREAMDFRLAFMADSREAVLKALTEFATAGLAPGVLTGQVKKGKGGAGAFDAEADAKSLIQVWFHKKKYAQLADLWVKGFPLDWNPLYESDRPRRISLPTYPFDKESYWVGINRDRNSGNGTGMAASLHPLLHQNTSDLWEQRFSSAFTGREPFLADYASHGMRVFPWSAYLEMARAAVVRAGGAAADEGNGLRFKAIAWFRPVVLGEPAVHLHIGIASGTGEELSFEIYGDSKHDDEAPEVHCRGSIVPGISAAIPDLELADIQARCSGDRLDSKDCYRALRSAGMEYGAGYQGIESLQVGSGEILAKLRTPASFGDGFMLHPGVLDGVLQAVVGVMEQHSSIQAPWPTSLEELEVIHPCHSAMWIYLRTGDGRPMRPGMKFDSYLCDETGRICLAMKGLVLAPPEPYEVMTFEEVWQEAVLNPGTSAVGKTLVCFLSRPENQNAFAQAWSGVDAEARLIFVTKGNAFEKRSPREYRIAAADPVSYRTALQSIQHDVGGMDAVLYLWALEDPSCIQDPSAIVFLLQAIAGLTRKPGRFLLSAQIGNALDRCYLESWIGFERSLGLVLPETQVAAIYHDASGADPEFTMDDWAQTLRSELGAAKAQSSLYRSGKRHVYQIQPVPVAAATPPLRSGGTYLISGGLGGLGYLFAEHLAKTLSANLILTGRTVLNSAKQSQINRLEAFGSRVFYLQADIGDRDAMTKGLHQAKKLFGEIHGVLHAAGVAIQQTVFEKGLESIQTVLTPKIEGTLVIDALTQREPLDFICYFSSTAAILGDFGACDYAVANRFQMAYAHYRNQLQRLGKRQGQAIAINWPLWRDGGMSLEDEQTEMYLKSSGQRYLEAQEGIEIFERILGQERGQWLVLAGRQDRVLRFLGLSSEPASAKPLPAATARSGGNQRPVAWKGLSLAQCLEWDLKEQISKLLKIPREKITREENLAEFGFDSIYLAKFASVLTEHLGIQVSPAVFFGHSSLDKLVHYFLAEYPEAIRAFYPEEVSDPSPIPAVTLATTSPPTASKTQRIKKPRFAEVEQTKNSAEPIAIIGMSGRFPESYTIEQMWSLLAEGRDAVKEIPADRFDWRRYYQASPPEPGKTNSKWCGCIPGAAEFDPLFFEISPREAESMDPRQRLLMQEAWRALEDAGYGPARIQSGKIGMFVGVEDGDYQKLVKEKGSVTSNHTAILAARLAYFLNLSGPVMAINTACSSGLVAAHEACLSLRAGECDTAIAAGVNLMLTPDPFINMSQAGMLSGSGKCHAFDAKADGLVPGEAVAVVVFKRLSQAKADGDPIYAIVRGSGINYDGKTNGITAPSGVSQVSLLKSVYDQYQINPEEMDYIITHGTGTKLGDPIELNALNDAFKEYTHKQSFCAVTSTKSNFGHTFAASGLVSLIALVQAMRHETIPASLHCEQVNDYINWSESPFYVNKVNRPWPAIPGQARLGAVSAFGMSGTNAHLVLQSWDGTKPQPGDSNDGGAAAPYTLLAVSARTPEAMQEKIDQLIGVLRDQTGGIGTLPSISYTLLEGRQHFDCRCAVVIQDAEDAVYVLQKAGGREKLPNLFQGKVARDFTGQKTIYGYARELLKQSGTFRHDRSRYQECLFALADLYCQGYDLPWNVLFGDHRPSMVHLPAYPFARDSYWASPTEAVLSAEAASSAAVVHPLLHHNTSDFTEQRFSSVFNGQEFFLADHRVKGFRVLPGVAYLEMVRAAVVHAAGVSDQTGVRLNHMVWSRPIAVGDQPVTVHIGLFPEDNGEIAFEIYTEADQSHSAPLLHSQGTARLLSPSQETAMDLQALRTADYQQTYSGEQCYQAFRTMQLEYGTTFQGIRQLYVAPDRILAKLSLPSTPSEPGRPLVLHPGMMDSALQSSIGWMMDSSGHCGEANPAIPFALDQLEILGKSTGSTMWALIRKHDGTRPAGGFGSDQGGMRKLDVELYDEEGALCVRMKGCASRILEDEPGTRSAETGSEPGPLLLEPIWREASAAGVVPDMPYNRHLVLLCELNHIDPQTIENKLSHARCLAIGASHLPGDVAERFEAYAVQLFEEIQSYVQCSDSGKMLIQIVVPSEGASVLYRGFSGLLRTAQLENPKLVGQVMEVEADDDAVSLVGKLRENRNRSGDLEIRYRDGERQLQGWNELMLPPEAGRIPWRDGGVYLITGGTGGLGLIFAQEIVRQTRQATLILTGRSALGEEKQARLKSLEQAGARIEYHSADVTRKEAVYSLIQMIRTKYGKLHGIIHSAGVVRDNFILKKNPQELREVLGPKVAGLVNLDEATREMDLDFLILFSSSTGTLGNAGQADYAMANTFMDAYAEYRNSLTAAKQRHGKTLSVNWPLWKEGGMKVHPGTEKYIRETAGLIPMRTETGIQALYDAIASGRSQVMVLEGDRFRLRQQLLASTHPERETGTASVAVESASGRLLNRVKATLAQLLAQLFNVATADIDADVELREYGLDMTVLAELVGQVNHIYQLELNAGMFMESLTLDEMADYLISQYGASLSRTYGMNDAKPPKPREASIGMAPPGPDSLADKALNYFKKLISAFIKLPVHQIENDAHMEKYGLDSVLVMELTTRLEKTFGSLSKTLFFEYQSMEELTRYFLEHYPDKLAEVLGTGEKSAIAGPEMAPEKAANLPEAIPSVARRRSRFAAIAEPKEDKAAEKALDIAIIGLSGRYSGANNLQEFWHNLRDGKDTITEIPEDRWDHRLYFHEDKNIPGKTYSKWGGFIDGVAEFDPLFFHISPREAEMMDPQERLFLECVYSTLEDAGYTRQVLGEYQGNGMPGNVGVFVGVMYEEYQLYAAQAQLLGHPLVLSGNPASIANRVSFFCNFHGPSMAVDTMCSSSLSTIHLACHSLQRGECEAAIAGGVNVSIHPNKYLVLGQGKFASSKGRCESFGEGGDGYVPGEGVGAVLLKPLAKAIADGDHIYGVIKGTAVNHGGKTNSYTVPNPNAQSDVIKRALRESGVHPRTISYMEAHGTGTSLGDPIEIAGLTKIFREYTQDHQFCAIGSVKSNIGHCESAAGIAGITKILLQFKYRQLVPSLHSKSLNPNIDFDHTPFVVQQELADLKRPVVTIDGETREYPIIAGVSSFGAGGSNAHIIISEYVPEEWGQASRGPTGAMDPGRVMVVLSAKNADRLKAQAQQLAAAIREGQIPEECLPDLAYTLQIGREAMEERLAMVVSSLPELSEKLEGFLAGTEDMDDLYHGQVKRNKDMLDVFTADDDMQLAIESWIAKKKYSKLLELWVKGLDFNWHKLYSDRPSRISLPTYPFAKERYWFPQPAGQTTDSVQAMAAVARDPGSRRLERFLSKQWELCPDRQNRLSDQAVLICTNEQNRPLAQLLATYFPHHRIMGPEDVQAHIEQPESHWRSYGGWIDLIGGDQDSEEAQAWIVGLQRLIEYGPREGLRLLGVTCGLEAFRNANVRLPGAERASLYRMLQNEYGHLRSRHLDTDPGASDLERAEQIAREFSADSRDPEVCYRNGERYRAFLGEVPEPQDSRLFRFPEDHVLWITGGTRGLGYLCAQHFVSRYGVKRLVLTGRETLPPRKEWDDLSRQSTPVAIKIQAIRSLEAAGANVSVSSVPLTDTESLQRYLAEIRSTVGPIGGVIHCAGIGDADNPAFIRKTAASVQAILEPKVAGLEALYQALKNEPLKFFMLFSSVSSIIPSLAVGQSDYAMANAYMDYFAQAHASELPVLSVQWPSWKETGMGEMKSKVYQQTGLLSITDAEGLELLDRLLAGTVGPVVLPAVVNPDKWRPSQLLLLPGAERSTGASGSNAANPKPSGVQGERGPEGTVGTAAHQWLKQLFGKELKLDPEKLEADTEFQYYGMDSVLLAQVVRQMDQKLGGVALEPSALLEYPTIQSLADYLASTYPEALASLDAAAAQTNPVEPRRIPETRVEPAAPLPMNPLNTPEIMRASNRSSMEKVAVVGMACHFPDAADIRQYWQNLRAGRDSIREVPKSRWNWERHYDPQGFREGKSISKWGAFLAEIEAFDPEYFNMAEGIAHQIDPLQRQWLEVSAEALADAGFTKKELWGKAVGIFAGARTGNFGNKFHRTDKDRIIGTGQNFIAAHLAHIYNFKGPNMVIDTACSSSLTAIHSAVRSIQSGEAELALAGGVDILLDEAVYLTLSSAKVLSPDGRCKTFNAEANGIGLGEGCGVLVLKPLHQAIQDGNKIYGVIDGSAINSDGNTMGVTTPNPEAQRQLIEKAIAASDINPETITYLETHGTGTLIGDPIELKALTQVFGKYSSQKQFCGVGSVKSNIGHLLSAAGAASVIKVLLAMIHRELPPTLHCANPNPRFKFEDSPFYIVQAAQPWTTPSGVLRAGISAFGLGGNNAHILLSNEGIPADLRASVVPRGEKIVYNRKRYWPEENAGSDRKDSAPSQSDGEAEFLEFFQFNQE